MNHAQRLLCLVTNRHRLTPEADAIVQTERLITQVRAAARAGVDLIQVRERDLDGRTLMALVEQLLTAISKSTAKIVVNDRLDVALAAGAHGVHLRSDSFAAGRARQLGGDSLIVGRSVHSAEEAVQAAAQGALDYLVLGTVFESISKPRSVGQIGVGELARACVQVNTPVMGIGGITVENAALVAKTGAGIASIGLFIPPPGAMVEPFVTTVIGSMRRTFDSCRVVPYH